MKVLIVLVLLLVIIYLFEHVTLGLFYVNDQYRKAREASRRNCIVINGRKYYPRRVGRETDCKTECPLYAHCEKGSHSLCMALQHPYEDVIMVEDGREE